MQLARPVQPSHRPLEFRCGGERGRACSSGSISNSRAACWPPHSTPFSARSAIPSWMPSSSARKACTAERRFGSPWPPPTLHRRDHLRAARPAIIKAYRLMPPRPSRCAGARAADLILQPSTWPIHVGIFGTRCRWGGCCSQATGSSCTAPWLPIRKTHAASVCCGPARKSRRVKAQPLRAAALARQVPAS